MFVLLTAIILYWSFYLFKIATGKISISAMNIGSYVFFTMMVWTVFGAVELIYGISKVDFLVPKDEDIRFWGWVGIMYSMIGIPLGMLALNRVRRISNIFLIDNKYHDSFLEKPIRINHKFLKNSIYVFSWFSIIVLAYGITTLNEIPLMNMLFTRLDYSTLYQQRNSVRLFEGFTSLISSILILLSGFVQVFTFIMYGYWKQEGKKKDFILFLILLIFSAILLTFDLSKGRILFFFIALFILFIKTGKKVRITSLLFYSFAGVFSIGLLYTFFMGSIESRNPIVIFLEALFVIPDRVFVGQISGWYNALYIFPERYDFLLFSTTGRYLHELLGLPFSYDYGIILQWYENTAAGKVGIGHSTTFYMGEAWSNFGLVGVIIAPFLVGIFIQYFNLFFITRPKTPFLLGLYISFILQLPLLTNFQGFYYPNWIFQYMMVILAIIFFAYLQSSVSRRTIYTG